MSDESTVPQKDLEAVAQKVVDLLADEGLTVRQAKRVLNTWAPQVLLDRATINRALT